ncbi:PEBP-like protein [Obba rivulosa]|uniref:PEBP-like protein n=1 Tax=Obba rivulosa TaxID=1052685 RepID=A0A8E2AZ04_9APHY|nr:PEBP-like protein [Obba rivulosa]
MADLDPLSSVVTSLKREGIIPDVLPDSFSPSVLFSVNYPSGMVAMLGNELTVQDTLDEPTVTFVPMNLPQAQADSAGESAADEVSYTLAMLDPDAPSRKEPLYKCFRHWVVTGLQSPPRTSSETSSSAALATRPATTPYRPPGPRPGSGLHRYIFLLFEEPPSREPLLVPPEAPEHGVTLEERRSWDPLTFGERYGLTLVGANYFVIRATD